MAGDPYTAIWVSHSSISDYLKCPRAYYLKNVYRNPVNNKRISLMQPALALGQTVHGVLDELGMVAAEDRASFPYMVRYRERWKGISGQRGGFSSPDEEERYFKRGEAMIGRVMDNPGPLVRKAIRLRDELPHYWLSEEDNVILCGKIDWLEYDPMADGVRIIDFKTGKFDEDPGSLQLPIYYLLVANVQKRPVIGAQYWYLDRDDAPTDIPLPGMEEANSRVREAAKRVALARKLERFVCKSKEGCASCRPYERILAGKAVKVGTDSYNQDVYVLTDDEGGS